MTIPGNAQLLSTQNALLLVVDDAALNRKVVIDALTRHGYQVISAQNGRQALDLLQESPQVDLILLDLVMPEMDGFAFMEARQKMPELAGIPVIVNSSLDDFGSIAKALTMGAYDYFTKPLSQDDLDIILPLKIRNAVTNKRLMDATQRQNEVMQRELEMAGRYQQFLLPKQASLAGAKVTYLFQPCSGVGGDYFDFFSLADDRWGLVVADVSGHGMASAMVASIVKALFPGYLERYLSPAKALSALNDNLLNLTPEDVFVTAFAALFDPAESRLSWTLAGHPPPFFLPKTGEAVPLAMENTFLGIFEAGPPLLELEDRHITVQSQDRLALYTDGLLEAPDPQGRQYGMKRLQAKLLANRFLNQEQTKQMIWKDLQSYVQGEFPDDVAFILVDFS